MVMRFGLVGVGRWGRNYVRTIAGLDGCALALAASRNPETAGLVPAGCRVVADWHDLLDPALIDAVVIASPPETHAEIALAALAAGLPVLAEKPLTQSLPEAEAILRAAESADLLVAVEHTHLYSPAFRALQSLAAEAGPVRRVIGRAGNQGPFRDTPVLWDWGPHDFAMALTLFGTEPDRVAARLIDARPMPGGRGETVEIALDFPDGGQADIRLSNILGHKERRLTVFCEGAVLVYDDLAPARLVRHPASPALAIPDGPGEEVPCTAQSPLTTAVREFAAAVAAGSRDRSGLRLGVAVVRALDRCEAAIAGL